MKKTKINAITAVVIIILVVAALAIWFFPEGGLLPGDPDANTDNISGQLTWSSPWDGVDTNAPRDYVNSWLDTEPGKSAFGNETAGSPVPIFNEDKELIIWIVPLVNSDGLFTAYIQLLAGESFSLNSVTKFSVFAPSFINKDTAINKHTSLLFQYGSQYPPENIMESFIVLKDNGDGFNWMTDIIVDGELMKRIFEETDFWLDY